MLGAVKDEPMSLRAATRLRLEETAGVVMYDDLRTHLDRNAVFVVRRRVSLVECGVAVAMDDVDVVRQWIEKGHLRKPSRRELATWPEASERRWRAVVVQPYVLIQDP
jgi:hypothetical protein